MAKRNGQVWVEKRAIFGCLRWNLETREQWIRTCVICGPAGGNLEQISSFIGILLAFPRWASLFQSPAFPYFSVPPKWREIAGIALNRPEEPANNKECNRATGRVNLTHKICYWCDSHTTLGLLVLRGGGGFLFDITLSNAISYIPETEKRLCGEDTNSRVLEFTLILNPKTKMFYRWKPNKIWPFEFKRQSSSLSWWC